MTGQQQLVPFAIKSYRYLRLSIVVVVAALMASVLLEVHPRRLLAGVDQRLLLHADPLRSSSAVSSPSASPSSP